MAAGGNQTARREVREDLRAWYAQFGETPTARELDGRADGAVERRHAFHDRQGRLPPSLSRIRRVYGTLNLALRAAQLPRRGRGQRRDPRRSNGNH